jgi:acetyl-CoA acetyltransferase family protein
VGGRKQGRTGSGGSQVREAVIVAMARTPVGRSHKGSLVGVDAYTLAEIAVGAAIARSGIPATDVDDIIMGEVLQGGGNIARHTAVRLGLSSAPGLAVNRYCASGFASVQMAVAAIASGMCDVVVAGGSESISTMPGFRRPHIVGPEHEDWVPPTHPPTAEAPNWDMSITVGENAARLGDVSRIESDEWALRSHRNAVASIDAGWFDDEIVAVELDGPAGTVRFELDEGPRRDTSRERLAALPVLHPELPDATVTAGNAGGVNDAAAAVVIVSADHARAHGLEPLARIRSWSSVGVPPAETGLAPAVAIPKALHRVGLEAGDVELFEINEAFCSVPIANIKHLGLDPSIVNVNGSGCSLGHPVAATGTRMIMTMIGELRRRDQTVGCVSACAGGGMGSATVIERLS